MAVQACQVYASFTAGTGALHARRWDTEAAGGNVGILSRRQPGRLHIRAEGEDDDFEAKLATIRRRGGSGTGKKAELRKARKEGSDSAVEPKAESKTEAKESILLAATPLQDQSSGGLPVSLGFNAYTERLNGRLAGLGLAALVSVELASGTGLLTYHDGSTIGIQIYFILATSALYIKWDKEKRSVWPK